MPLWARVDSISVWLTADSPMLDLLPASWPHANKRKAREHAILYQKEVTRIRISNDGYRHRAMAAGSGGEECACQTLTVFMDVEGYIMCWNEKRQSHGGQSPSPGWMLSHSRRGCSQHVVRPAGIPAARTKAGPAQGIPFEQEGAYQARTAHSHCGVDSGYWRTSVHKAAVFNGFAVLYYLNYLQVEGNAHTLTWYMSCKGVPHCYASSDSRNHIRIAREKKVLWSYVFAFVCFHILQGGDEGTGLWNDCTERWTRARRVPREIKGMNIWTQVHFFVLFCFFPVSKAIFPFNLVGSLDISWKVIFKNPLYDSYSPTWKLGWLPELSRADQTTWSGKQDIGTIWAWLPDGADFLSPEPLFP